MSRSQQCGIVYTLKSHSPLAITTDGGVADTRPTITQMATQVAFIAVVVVVFLAFLAATKRVASHARDGRRFPWIVAGAVTVGWLVVPGVLASAGMLDRYNPLPAPGLVVVLAISVGTAYLALSEFGTRLLRAVPAHWIVGYQTFRLPLELILHRLYLDGVIPVQMTYAGRNFDIITGVTAMAVAVVMRQGRAPRWLVHVWNLLGLALLINIVTVAVLSTPVPFRLFLNEPANLVPSTFPYVWLPTFLVQAAWFGHLLLLRTHARAKGTFVAR